MSDQNAMPAINKVDHPATTFDSDKDRCQTIRMQRQDGILELHLHAGGGPLQWSLQAHWG